MSSIKEKLQQQKDEVARKRAIAQETAKQQKDGAKFAREEMARQREVAKLAERAMREERKKEQQSLKDLTRMTLEEGRKAREQASAERKAKREEESQKLRALLRRQQEAREEEIAMMTRGTSHQQSTTAAHQEEVGDGGEFDDVDATLQMALDAAHNALLDDPDLLEDFGLDGEGGDGGGGGGDDDDDVSSVNSKDLADEDFMQGFREEVLGPRIAEMQEEITLLKKEAVRLMKAGDKPTALDSLRRAKQMEAELAELQK